jgi:hypothetical protein
MTVQNASSTIIRASSAGIVTGFGDGTFRPDAGVTREQIAAMLHRHSQLTMNNEELTIGDWAGVAAVFSDAGDVAEWARGDIVWAVGARVINGSGGKLLPRGDATCAQGAQLMYNMASAGAAA